MVGARGPVAIMSLPRRAFRLLCRAVAVVAGGAALGCAQAPKPLYYWDGFQAQLYEHFRADGSGPEDQLRVLTGQAQQARAYGAVLPPGFHGHLAMLYLRLGRYDEAKQALEAEKASFPESERYMDFLLKHMSPPKPKP